MRFDRTVVRYFELPNLREGYSQIVNFEDAQNCPAIPFYTLLFGQEVSKLHSLSDLFGTRALGVGNNNLYTREAGTIPGSAGLCTMPDY